MQLIFVYRMINCEFWDNIHENVEILALFVYFSLDDRQYCWSQPVLWMNVEKWRSDISFDIILLFMERIYCPSDDKLMECTSLCPNRLHYWVTTVLTDGNIIYKVSLYSSMSRTILLFLHLPSRWESTGNSYSKTIRNHFYIIKLQFIAKSQSIFI
jgi:hypothetical protein